MVAEYGQLEFERWRRRRLPLLTAQQRLVLAAIVLAAGRPLSEVSMREVGVMRDFDVRGWKRGGVFKRLLAMGLIEVVSLSPAVYRVTRLGRLTRSLRG